MKSIIELAKQAGLDKAFWLVEDSPVHKFAALVRAAALEEAAGVCDIHARGWEMNPGANPRAGFIASSNCAAAIRALKGQA